MFSSDYLIALQKRYEQEQEKLKNAFQQQLEEKQQIIQQLQVENQTNLSQMQLLKSQHNNEIIILQGQLEELELQLKHKEQKEHDYISSISSSLEDEITQVKKRHAADMSQNLDYYSRSRVS